MILLLVITNSVVSLAIIGPIKTNKPHKMSVDPRIVSAGTDPNFSLNEIVKLNIDDHPDTPAKYGVRGIPTMILFKDGEIADTKVGAAPKAQLKSWLEAAL